MDLNAKRILSIKRLIASFRFAGNGMKWVMGEPNMRIHVAAGILVSAAGFVFGLSQAEWCIVILLIAGVITLEMVNTAIEKTVDLVTKEYEPLAKAAKDIAAGAVLVYSIAAAIIGFIIFIPKW